MPSSSQTAATNESASQQEVSILCANAYLVPWFYVAKEVIQGDEYGINSCSEQHERAKLLAELCKDSDVVALQECWGGGSDVLQREMKASHHILPRYQSWEGLGEKGYLADYFNTARHHLSKNGGLWCAIKEHEEPSVDAGKQVMWSHHHTFVANEGEEMLNRSVSFALLDVSHKWAASQDEGKKLLLIVNSHISAHDVFTSSPNRGLQRNEILEQLTRLVAGEELSWVDWSQCGVLLMGDLNTAFCEQGNRDGTKETGEYQETLKMFNARDLYVEVAPESARGDFTFDGEKNELVSKDVADHSARIDYVLAIDHVADTKFLKLEATEYRIVDDVPCSDHYPLAVSVKPQ